MKAPKEHWVTCGFGLLVERGPTALKVETLCKAMALSKGAFYHHFSSLAEYQVELLSAWETAHTDGIIQAVSMLGDVKARRQLLTEMANSRDQQLENALRAWSLYHSDVARRLQGVDERRMDFIRQLIEEDAAPGVDPLTASRVVYAHFVGWQQLHTILPETALEEMESLLKQFLLV